MKNDYQQNQTKKETMEQAEKNTANVEKRIASTCFERKLGQDIKTNVSNVISKAPVLNQLNDKLNNGGNNKSLNNPTKGMSKLTKNNTSVPNLKPTGNKIPKSNLTNDKKDGNLMPNALKRRKRGFLPSFENRIKNSENITDNDNKDEASLDDDSIDETPSSTTNLSKVNIKQILFIVKISPIILMFFFIILFIVMIAGESNLVSNVSPIISLNSHNSSERQNVNTEDNPELLEAELKFNDAIVGSADGSVEGIIPKYQTEYGITLDKYTLLGVLLYPENSDINYSKAINYIDTVAELMIYKNEDGTAYAKNIQEEGEFYNDLLNSDFLTSYYETLENTDYESKKILVDDIYSYIELLREFDNYNVGGSVVSDTSVVHMQTCAYSYNYTKINGMTVYDNPLTNEGTTYPSYLNLKDYIKGVLMTEVGSYIKSEYKEGLKAMSIVALSFLLSDKSSGFDLKSGEMYFPTGDCRQVACDPNNGCTYLKGKTAGRYGTAFVGLKRFGSSSGQHSPLTEEKNTLLDEIISEIFGQVIVKKGVTAETFSGSSDVVNLHHYANLNISGCEAGYCMGQVEVMKDALNGMNYTDMFKKYYYNISFDVINVTEGLYVLPEYYTNGEYSGSVIFYDQSDYRNVKFCGRSNATISSSGCGVVASAIVTSSFLNSKQYDPPYMMNLAHQNGDCGYNISGTNDAFFSYFANKFNFGYQRVSKRQTNVVLQALQAGNAMVIAHMGKGHFTNNGHYIVLTATDSSGKVYVHDPNNKNNKRNRDTGNGWYDINMIASELKGSFHIITKR